jgi:hypothetical protein
MKTFLFFVFVVVIQGLLGSMDHIWHERDRSKFCAQQFKSPKYFEMCMNPEKDAKP